MKKRLWLFLAMLIGLIAIGILLVLFMFYYEPAPDRNDVEEMVSASNLEEFGEVEGSYLLTPRNYGFYNDDSIYIVEQYLHEGGDYGNRYVVIKEGIAVTNDDEPAVDQIYAKGEVQDGYLDDFQIRSKHQMIVYTDNEKIEEKWIFKVTYKYDGVYFLSFLLPEETEENRFNLFTEGYQQFLEF
ncbi:hypothetical protein HNQ44_001849 [Planomicrobium koreense]|uniref:Uncharacterized protein n=1 Tax=Planococcus koreensis TaxID=112331 RepID=A0A7W8CS70_9BACL|nr:hypothetical protein [Planococcus koreensis]MBB5180421.1 hypothetical protein [Planococcus koreensis]